MFTSIEQGLRVYREKLAHYKQRMAEPNGMIQDTLTDPNRIILAWQGQIRAMESVLGLGADEKRTIYAEMDIHSLCPEPN